MFKETMLVGLTG